MVFTFIKQNKFAFFFANHSLSSYFFSDFTKTNMKSYSLFPFCARKVTKNFPLLNFFKSIPFSPSFIQVKIIESVRHISIIHNAIPSDYSNDVDVQLESLSAKHLGHYALRMSKLHAANESFWMKLSSCVKAKCDEMDSKDCLRILNAYSIGSYVDHDLLKLLGKRTALQAFQYRVCEISEICYNFSMLGVLHSLLYANLSTAFCLKIMNCNSSDLTRMAFAFAKINLRDSYLFARIAVSSMLLLNMFTPSELSNLLLSFALLNIRHDGLLYKSAFFLTSKIYSLSAMHLVCITFAYAKFNLVFPCLVEKLSECLPNVIQDLSSSIQLAELSISCNKLGIHHPKLTEAYITNINFEELSFSIFCKCALALSELRIIFPALWNRVCRAAIRKLKVVYSRENIEDLLAKRNAYEDEENSYSLLRNKDYEHNVNANSDSYNDINNSNNNNSINYSSNNANSINPNSNNSNGNDVNFLEKKKDLWCCRVNEVEEDIYLNLAKDLSASDSSCRNSFSSQYVCNSSEGEKHSKFIGVHNRLNNNNDNNINENNINDNNINDNNNSVNNNDVNNNDKGNDYRTVISEMTKERALEEAEKESCEESDERITFDNSISSSHCSLKGEKKNSHAIRSNSLLKEVKIGLREDDLVEGNAFFPKALNETNFKSPSSTRIPSPPDYNSGITECTFSAATSSPSAFPSVVADEKSNDPQVGESSNLCSSPFFSTETQSSSPFPFFPKDSDNSHESLVDLIATIGTVVSKVRALGGFELLEELLKHIVLPLAISCSFLSPIDVSRTFKALRSLPSSWCRTDYVYTPDILLNAHKTNTSHGGNVVASRNDELQFLVYSMLRVAPFSSSVPLAINKQDVSSNDPLANHIIKNFENVYTSEDTTRNAFFLFKDCMKILHIELICRSLKLKPVVYPSDCLLSIAYSQICLYDKPYHIYPNEQTFQETLEGFIKTTCEACLLTAKENVDLFADLDLKQKHVVLAFIRNHYPHCDCTILENSCLSPEPESVNSEVKTSMAFSSNNSFLLAEDTVYPSSVRIEFLSVMNALKIDVLTDYECGFCRIFAVETDLPIAYIFMDFACYFRLCDEGSEGEELSLNKEQKNEGNENLENLAPSSAQQKYSLRREKIAEINYLENKGWFCVCIHFYVWRALRTEESKKEMLLRGRDTALQRIEKKL